MITKKEGAEDSCPSCHQMLVCRKVIYKGEKKDQWQYKDKEEAHFSFDFKTKKSACKESTGGSQASTSNTSATKEINLDSLKHLTKEEQDKIIEDTEKVGESLACQLKAIDNLVARGVISDKYDRGMVFNAVVQYRVH
jgi:hypothetical protein